MSSVRGAARIVVAVFIGLCSVSAKTDDAAVASRCTSFDSALAAATANVASPEGQLYDHDVGVAFGQQFVATMQRCTAGVADAELGAFDLLFRVARDGSVEETLARPDTRVAQCVRRDVERGRFPAPARASYWVRIELSVTP